MCLIYIDYLCYSVKNGLHIQDSPERLRGLMKAQLIGGLQMPAGFHKKLWAEMKKKSNSPEPMPVLKWLPKGSSNTALGESGHVNNKDIFPSWVMHVNKGQLKCKIYCNQSNICSQNLFQTCRQTVRWGQFCTLWWYKRRCCERWVIHVLSWSFIEQD